LLIISSLSHRLKYLVYKIQKTISKQNINLSKILVVTSLLNVFSIDSFTPSQGEKHMNSILYNPLDLSGAADDPTNSDTLESFAKTGTDFASGLGIGKVLSVDESPSAGLTI
jgi:hypothetical protein